MDRNAEAVFSFTFSLRGLTTGEAAEIAVGAMGRLIASEPQRSYPVLDLDSLFSQASEVQPEKKKALPKKRKAKEPEKQADPVEPVVSQNGSDATADKGEQPLVVSKKKKKDTTAAVPSGDKPKKKPSKKNAKAKGDGGQQIDAIQQDMMINYDEAY